MSVENPNEADILKRALALQSSQQRAQYLNEACGENVDLRDRIDEQLALQSPPPTQPGTDPDVTEITGPRVLESLARTIDVPQVSLQEPKVEGEDPIQRPNSPEIPGRSVQGRYRLDGEIARGGMGAIIKGRDIDLGRDLAIKVLLDEHKAKPEVIQRFVEEAQVGGQLQHPGIAPVYELGQFDDQRPFFSMKLVKGKTLSSLLAERETPAVDRGRFTGIFEQICQTMAYAHTRGVIHRDLKPGNIMVGAFGEVQVMDWGLAKVLAAGGVADEKKARARQWEPRSVIQTLRSIGGDSSETSGSIGSLGSQTQMGSVMGTPAYMPPEQALGEVDHLDERTDVFGLGAILAEILTGKPPYVSTDGTQIFRLATRGKLSECFQRLDDCGADAELVALAKQCLEPEPADRPREAGVVADRVTRHLESVESKLREAEMKRAAASARAEEERKRRRVTLTSAAVVLLLLLLISAISVYSAIRVAAARDAALDNARRAESAELAAVSARDELAEALNREQASRSRAQETVVDMLALQGLNADENDSPLDAALWFANATHASALDPERRRTNLLRVSAWTRNAIRPTTAFQLPKGTVRELKFSNDGRYFLLLGNRGTLNVHDRKNETDIELDDAASRNVYCVDWHPNSEQLAVGTESRVVIVSMQHATVIAEHTLPFSVTAVKYDASGARLAIGGSAIRFLDTDSGEISDGSLPHSQPVIGLAFDPSGRRLATVTTDLKARVFDVGGEASGTKALFEPIQIARPLYNAKRPVMPRFMDDNVLLVMSDRRTLRLCDADTGEVRRSMVLTEIHAIVDDPTGRYLAICDGSGLRLLRRQDARLMPTPIRHKNRVMDAAFSPDGSRILTASIDGRARLWSAPFGVANQLEIPHQGEVFRAAFSRDGQAIATSQYDGLVRIWEMPDSEQDMTSVSLPIDEYFVLSNSGRYVAPGGFNLGRRLTSVRVVDVKTGAPAGPALELDGFLNAAAFSPDDQSIALLSSAKQDASRQGWEAFKKTIETKPGSFNVRDWRDGRSLFDPIVTNSEPIDAVWSPDGQRLVILCGSGQGFIVNGRTGSKLAEFQEPGRLTISLHVARRLRFAPDGSGFVTLGFGTGAHFRDRGDGKVLTKFRHSNLSSAEFSFDSKKLVTASRDGEAIVWDVASGERLNQKALDHQDWVFRARFSEDGRRLLTACRDHMARLWDWQSGTVLAAMEHDDEVFDAVLHPAQRIVVTTGRDGTVRLWSMEGRPISPKRSWAPYRVHQVSITPDGTRAIVPTSTNTLGLMDLRPWNDPALAAWSDDDILRLCEVVSGRRVVDAALVNLSSREWLDRWTLLRSSKGIATDQSSSADRIVWHRREAERLHRLGQWESAIWHLDQILRMDPKDSNSLYLRGYSLHQMRKDKEAVESLSQCLELKPDHVESRHWRAHAQMRLPDYESAVTDLTLLLQSDQHNSHYLFMRGLCHRSLDRPREAFLDYSTAYRITPPSSAVTVRGVLHLYRDLAAAFRDGKDWKLALDAAAALRDSWTLIPESDRTASDFFNRACALSLGIEIVEQAAHDNFTAASQVGVEKWQSEAVEALKQSELETLEGRRRIESDSDLDAIRDLPEFKQMLKASDVKSK